METVDIEYKFRLDGIPLESFEVQLDTQTGKIVIPLSNNLPGWTLLEFEKCPNCPLDPEDTERCPAAVSIVDLVRCFDGLSSFDQIEVEVNTSERRLIQQTAVQSGISSLMGLLIAASGCPRSAFFRPMARFHLPLSEPIETIYRVTTMYLLAQYFREKEKMSRDQALEGLSEIYRNMQIMNNALAERIRMASETDSSVNALVMLDMHAKSAYYVIDDFLDELRPMFSAYF